MKILFSILFATLFICSPELSKVRIDYKNAIHNKENTVELHIDLASVNNNDSKVLVAYKGAVTTLMAKFAKNSKDKKDFFKEGATLIEYAVTEDSNNIEIRCIRLGVQENTPKVVKYRKSIPEDKQFILDHYKEITSSKEKDYIKGFILQSKSFTVAEKELIE